VSIVADQDVDEKYIGCHVVSSTLYFAKDLIIPKKIQFSSLGGIILPLTYLDTSSFSQLSGVAVDQVCLTGSLTIPDSVTSIGNYAFTWCSGLTGKLIIPNNVTIVGDYAFRSCSGLTGDWNIPNNVTSIGVRAFDGCIGLTGSLTIPNSVTIINSYAFLNCVGITELYLGNKVARLGTDIFKGCQNLMGEYKNNEYHNHKISCSSDNVYYIRNNKYYYCLGKYSNVMSSGINPSGTLSINSNTISIGTQAFDNYSNDCSGLMWDLIIPNSVLGIGAAAFRYFVGLTGSLNIPNSVE
jgi:hypothetical protein